MYQALSEETEVDSIENYWLVFRKRVEIPNKEVLPKTTKVA